MHEVGKIKEIFEEVERIAKEHDARKVIRIVLETGDISHLLSDHFRESFKLFRNLSPCTRETELEFRHLNELNKDDLVLRDVELEIEDRPGG